MIKKLAFIATLGLFTLFISQTISVAPLTPPPLASTHQLKIQDSANGAQPDITNFWDGSARFVVDVPITGLPMGESETHVMQNGEWWSWLHASDRSAGTVDQCGDPVEFPGCTVIYKSDDGGLNFRPESDPPVCTFACQQCPCDAATDHTPQQQYPRVSYDGDKLWLVYEYLGRSMLRTSLDGRSFSPPQRIAGTGLWSSNEFCGANEKINAHPFAIINTEQCLAGGPPGIFIEGDVVYIFVGLGQSPGGLGCFVGRKSLPPSEYKRCQNNPLLLGSPVYGDGELRGAGANPYWDFRMLSSADVHKVGDQYYMLFEGLRGPGPGDPGDTQFGLGLARTVDGKIDGRWEMYPGNPILVDVPANIGIGHADLVINQGQTYLFTSLDGVTRSRLVLLEN